MATPRTRPVFAVEVPSRDCVLRVLREQLGLPGVPCEGLIFRRHAVLQVAPSAQHLWSPYLNVELREEGEKVTLHGRFSPHPNVWTGFMAIYGVLAMLALGGFVAGLAQLSLGVSPWALSLVLAAGLMGAFVYGAIFIGQGLSAAQMYEMRSFIDDVVRRCRGSAPLRARASQPVARVARGSTQVRYTDVHAGSGGAPLDVLLADRLW